MYILIYQDKEGNKLWNRFFAMSMGNIQLAEGEGFEHMSFTSKLASLVKM